MHSETKSHTRWADSAHYIEAREGVHQGVCPNDTTNCLTSSNCPVQLSSKYRCLPWYFH